MRRTCCCSFPLAKWVALDPGVRTFLTCFSPVDGQAFKLGVNASGYLTRLALKTDALISERDILKGRDRRRKNRSQRDALRSSICRVSRYIRSLRRRVRALVDEMHWKCADWLCDTLTDIIIPPFNTSEMVVKKGRRIRSKTARAMLTMSFYTFRQRLLHTAAGCGVRVYIRGEEYTTQTCSNCGCFNTNVGGSSVFRCAAWRGVVMGSLRVTFS